MQELGTGVLGWNREERISDRYGVVKLFEKPGPNGDVIALRLLKEGIHGKLIAVVKDVRKASHIGDIFHGVFPTRSEVNERIVLGEGTLFFEDGGIGLVPEDGRNTLWLDMQALYRVHNQTVTLFFETSPLN